MTTLDERPALAAATGPAAAPQASQARQGRQDLHWDAVALPDGQMLAAAAARLLGRLSALAAQWDGAQDTPPGPGPAPDPAADKAAALTLIKAAHQLLCAATTGRPAAGLGGSR